MRSLAPRAEAAAVSGVADCESIHGGDERNSGPPDRMGAWGCAAAAGEAEVPSEGELEEARKVWMEGRGLGSEIGMGLRRMRGFRVLRKAMAADCGALQVDCGRNGGRLLARAACEVSKTAQPQSK
jgi:hypothetical protein